MPINVARKSAIIHRLMNYPFFFRSTCYLGRDGAGEEGYRWKGKKGRKREEEEEEKQRRGGKKNRRVNCFPAANGRQLKLKILDYLHRAFTHAYTRGTRNKCYASIGLIS